MGWGDAGDDPERVLAEGVAMGGGSFGVEVGGKGVQVYFLVV